MTSVHFSHRALSRFSQVSVFALATLLSACDPQLPSVVLIVDDGDKDVATGAVTLAIGPTLDALEEVALGDEEFPVSVTVVSMRTERTTLWVEARDVDGNALARATADESDDVPGVVFKQRGENVVNVTLLSACESGDEACDDGLFCNGVERCDGQVCRSGEEPCAASPFSCVEIACLEEEEACDVVVSHNICEPIALDGGVLEPTYCDVAEGCRPGQACFDDSECDDGLACNGPERCLVGRCVGGIPLVTDDENPCTVDACDESADTVLHVALGDGSLCVMPEMPTGDSSALGICLAGACGASVCGDGFVDDEELEQCDDANTDDDDGCTTACTPSRFVLEDFVGGALCDGMSLAEAGLGQISRVHGTPEGGFVFLDEHRRVIRRYLAGTDVLERVAGNGVPGHGEDGELAAFAPLAKSVAGLAVHPVDGTVFWVDAADPSGRVYATGDDGVLRVVAGSGSDASSGIGGDARSYALTVPSRILVTSTERLVIVNGYGEPELLRVDLTGPDANRVYRIDGGDDGIIAEGGLASTLRFFYIRALAPTDDGGFFASHANKGAVPWGISRFTPNGDDYDVVRVAGLGGEECDGDAVDGASATATPVCGPEHLVADVLGYAYCFARQSQHLVSCVDQGGIVHTVFGTGVEGTPTAGVSPIGNRVGWIEGLARMGDTLLVVGRATDYGERYAARIAADGSVVDLVVGDATIDGRCGMGSVASIADVSSPDDVDVLADGRVVLTATYAEGFVVDDAGLIEAVSTPGIRQVATGPSGQVVGLGDSGRIQLAPAVDEGSSSIAGGGMDAADGAIGDTILLVDPIDIAMPSDGVVYVLERAGQRLRRLEETLGGWVIETVVGTGIPDPADQGGPALLSSLAFPTALAVSGEGSIAIVDGTGVVKIVVDDTVSILGVSESASAVAFDAAQNLFVATTTHRIWRVPHRDGALRADAAVVVVGSGDARYVPGLGTDASIYRPTRLAVGADGALLVLQHEAHRVARVVRVPE
jgi:cysteine-rich repeat protein